MRDSTLIPSRENTHGSTCGTHESDHDAGPLHVDVVATTEEGTVAALRIAAGRAAELGAQINLIAAETVLWPGSLRKPLSPTIRLERKICGLVCKARIKAAVSIQIYMCRDRYQRLQEILQPHALVVVGGRNRWWSKWERELAEFLSGLGHQVLFAAVEKEEPKTSCSHETDGDQDPSRSSAPPQSVGPWTGHLPYWG